MDSTFWKARRTVFAVTLGTAFVMFLFMAALADRAEAFKPGKNHVVRQGPPSWAPAHGYRWKHRSGIDLVYDRGLGAWARPDRPDNFFHMGRFYRHQRDRWEVSPYHHGPWNPTNISALPPGLRNRYVRRHGGPGHQQHPGHWRGRGHFKGKGRGHDHHEHGDHHGDIGGHGRHGHGDHDKHGDRWGHDRDKKDHGDGHQRSDHRGHDWDKKDHGDGHQRSNRSGHDWDKDERGDHQKHGGRFGHDRDKKDHGDGHQRSDR